MDNGQAATFPTDDSRYLEWHLDWQFGGWRRWGSLVISGDLSDLGLGSWAGGTKGRVCGVVLSTDSRVFQSVVEEWAGRGGCELHQGGTSNEAGANGQRAPTTTQPTTLMRACRRWERDDTLQLATYTADLHYLQLSIRTGSALRLKLWSAARSPPPEKTPILSRLMCLKQNVARAQATAGSWLRPTSQRQARHQSNNTI